MRIRNLAIIEILALICTANLAQAQTSTFQATVPFEFVVGDQTLPSGTYIVERLLGKRTIGDATGVVVIKTADQQIYMVLITRLGAGRGARNKSTRNQISRLLFALVHDKQYLSEIWVAGDKAAHQLVHVPEEKTPRVSEVALIGIR